MKPKWANSSIQSCEDPARYAEFLEQTGHNVSLLLVFLKFVTFQIEDRSCSRDGQCPSGSQGSMSQSRVYTEGEGWLGNWNKVVLNVNTGVLDFTEHAKST